jgi:hypothetical protein
MKLPDLGLLNTLFQDTQSIQSTIDGFACFTSYSFSGVGAFCFCDTIDEWKKLYPAIIFIEALVDQEYEIYDTDDLTKLYEIYQKHQYSQWNDSDFETFRKDLTEIIESYDVNFLGKTTLLFQNNSEEEFLDCLHKQFGKNPNENKEEFLIFLDDFIS